MDFPVQIQHLNLGAVSGSTILFKNYFVFQLSLMRTVYKSIIIIVIVIVISYNSTIFIFQPISVENIIATSSYLVLMNSWPWREAVFYFISKDSLYKVLRLSTLTLVICCLLWIVYFPIHYPRGQHSNNSLHVASPHEIATNHYDSLPNAKHMPGNCDVIFQSCPAWTFYYTIILFIDHNFFLNNVFVSIIIYFTVCHGSLIFKNTSNAVSILYLPISMVRHIAFPRSLQSSVGHSCPKI